MGVSRRLLRCPNGRIASSHMGCRNGHIYLIHISVRTIQRRRFSFGCCSRIIDDPVDGPNKSLHETFSRCAPGWGRLAYDHNDSLVLCKRFPAAHAFSLAVAARSLLACESSLIWVSKLVRRNAGVVLRRLGARCPIFVSCSQSAFICSFAAITCLSATRLLGHSDATPNSIPGEGRLLCSGHVGALRAAGISNHRSRR